MAKCRRVYSVAASSGAPALRWFHEHVLAGDDPVALWRNGAYTVVHENRWTEALTAAVAWEQGPWE